MPCPERVRVLIVCVASLLGGCTSLSCGANTQKLAHLHPGMSRDETSALMGCMGKPVGGSADRFATVEWSGPGSLLFSRTYVVFLDDKLFTVSTEKRGGY